MKYPERHFQTTFNKWCKHNAEKPAAFELKVTNGGSLPFSAVKPHQRRALRVAKHGVLVFKIPDCGFQNPFDSLVMTGVAAYVVISFHGKRKEFVLVDIDAFLKEEGLADRKSLTEEKAKEIGFTVNL